MAKFPDHMSKTEQRIANKLLTAILKRGHSISVCDGYEFPLRRSTDRAAIQAETCATDMTEYHVYDGKNRIGWFWLIHGNEEDMISDMLDNDFCDEIDRELRT